MASLANQASGDSPENWHPGDVAECTGSGGWIHAERGGNDLCRGPEKGARLRASRVVLGLHPYTGAQIQWLYFAAYPGSFDASEFRKVQPRADALVAAAPRWLKQLLGQDTPA